MNGTISYYDKNAEEFCQATKDADMSFCRDKFKSLLEKKVCAGKSPISDRSKIHILDAGCGSGRDGKAFLDEGYRVTALDGSAQMCKEAEKLLKQKVFCMAFEELEFQREFDGIWACASLLHVSYREINGVLRRFWNALKEGGILYASFKYGEGERAERGRVFYDYKEAGLEKVMINNRFSIEDIFMTQDVREGRKDEQWINVLAGRSKSKRL